MYKNYLEFDAAIGFSAKAGFQLSPLQIQDVETLVDWGRSLICYEVGGGKTVVSTVVSLMVGSVVTVVTVPPILITPWVRWLNKVSTGVVAYRGTPKERATLPIATARWIVVSHAIFRDDFDKLEKALSAKHPELIVDEAHNAKNPASHLFKKITKLAAGNHLQLLTGTPTSKPGDSYAYIKLKSPDVYRNMTHFEAIHVAERDFYKKPTKWANLDMLADNFAIKTIKRTKHELHGYDNTPLFPDTTYTLEPAHQKLYEKLLDEQLLQLDDGSKIDATTAVKLYHAVQQIIVNYDYFSGNPDNRSAAYDLIDSVVDQTQCAREDNSKLIVWSVYKRTSRSVLAYFNSLGIKAVGAYSEVNTEKSIEAFMSDPLTRVLVAQPQSAGAGLNPQEVCAEAIFIETSVVPLYNKQAIGRLDRVGQKRKPTMRFAVAENTIQGYLLRQLFKNDDLVSQVERTKKSLREVLLGR